MYMSEPGVTSTNNGRDVGKEFAKSFQPANHRQRQKWYSSTPADDIAAPSTFNTCRNAWPTSILIMLMHCTQCGCPQPLWAPTPQRQDMTERA